MRNMATEKDEEDEEAVERDDRPGNPDADIDDDDRHHMLGMADVLNHSDENEYDESEYDEEDDVHLVMMHSSSAITRFCCSIGVL